MASALPKIMNRLGKFTAVITPLYDSIYSKLNTFKYIGEREVKIADESFKAKYYETIHDGVTYIFVENELFFKRANYYGYYDDDKRFLFYDFAILEYIELIHNPFDLLHINDWQTGLIPYLLDEIYR